MNRYRPVPALAARRVAEAHRKDLVVIVAVDRANNQVSVAAHGRRLTDRRSAEQLAQRVRYVACGGDPDRAAPAGGESRELRTRGRMIDLATRLAQYSAPEQHLFPELHLLREEARAIVRELTRPAVAPADVVGRIGGAR